MKQYRTINNLVGWITFIIAATVYCMTIEPTASFWDCPEFITTGYKLEVGHPPGAPFFMLVANLFSQFASDPSTVAKMVNYMSALMSGACILFLFWSITHLVRKLVATDENNITKGQLITIMGSGLVGALAYTFSDTFWFSAVEGEVYAFSSLFTAVVFWLILKWEDVANEPHSDRWLILIAYLTGLSIGVHLLNLLCLPAIVLVYYYKKVPNANAKGSLLALLASGILVAVVLYGMVPGIVKVGEKQDAHGHLLRADYRPVGYPILRARNKCCSNRHYSYRFLVLLSQPEDAGKHEREIPHFRTYAEHIIALYNDDRHRIFFLRHHRDPLYSQYTDGPKLT